MKKISLENIKSYFINLWKDFKFFVSNAFLLLKKNFKEVMLFTIICTILSLMFIDTLKYLFIHIVMNANGIAYISPDNLIDLLLSPICILLMIVFFLFVTFVALFEIAGLLHAYSMSQIGKETDLYSMFAAGYRTCIKALNPKNWLIILFILVLFPLADVVNLSSISFKAILPGFVMQTINYTAAYSNAYTVVWFLLFAVFVVYVFSINIFVLQKSDFIKSCSRSRRLQKGHYFKTALFIVVMSIAFTIIINSLSSIITVTINEIIHWFTDRKGVITRYSNLGLIIYAVSQILSASLGPALDNAGLTVLFYGYVDEKELLGSLTPETFKTIKPTKKYNRAMVIGVILLVVINFLFISNRYKHLAEDVNRPLVCAHRGDNVNAPENTLPAFELAISENLKWIELDTHQTKDGVIVVCHDDTINRVTGEKGNVYDLTYEELQQYEMGSFMPGDYEHVKFPTLKEVFELVKDSDMHVQVELKPTAYDKDFEEHVLQVINEAGMHDRVMIICLDDDPLIKIRELDPDITIAYCMTIAYGDVSAIDWTTNVSVEETNITPEFVYNCHEKGMKVFCWTVDEEDTIQYLVSCGVDVIGTDNPMLVNDVLDKANYNGGLSRVFYIMMNTIRIMGL